MGAIKPGSLYCMAHHRKITGNDIKERNCLKPCKHLAKVSESKSWSTMAYTKFGDILLDVKTSDEKAIYKTTCNYCCREIKINNDYVVTQHCACDNSQKYEKELIARIRKGEEDYYYRKGQS